MKIPILRKGDILLCEAPGVEVIYLLLEDQEQFSSPDAPEQYLSLKVLFNGKVNEKIFDRFSTLMSCDLYRHGKKIWSRVSWGDKFKMNWLLERTKDRYNPGGEKVK